MIALMLFTHAVNANAGCEVLDTGVVKGCVDLGSFSILPMNGVDHCREMAPRFDYSLHLEFFPGPDCDENWRSSHEECYGCSY